MLLNDFSVFQKISANYSINSRAKRSDDIAAGIICKYIWIVCSTHAHMHTCCICLINKILLEGLEFKAVVAVVAGIFPIMLMNST